MKVFHWRPCPWTFCPYPRSVAGHQLVPGTLGTDDIVPIGDKALSCHGLSTLTTDETVAVPVSLLKRDEPGPPLTSDGFATTGTPLGKQFAKTVCTIRFVFSTGKLLTCQLDIASGTHKTFLKLKENLKGIISKLMELSSSGPRYLQVNWGIRRC